MAAVRQGSEQEPLVKLEKKQMTELMQRIEGHRQVEELRVLKDRMADTVMDFVRAQRFNADMVKAIGSKDLPKILKKMHRRNLRDAAPSMLPQLPPWNVPDPRSVEAGKASAKKAPNARSMKAKKVTKSSSMKVMKVTNASAKKATKAPPVKEKKVTKALSMKAKEVTKNE